MFRPLFFMLVASALLLPRLGERPYWGDEMEDFNFISRILERGVPDMTGAHEGGALQNNSRGWHIYHSWAPLYENALAVMVGGWDNEFLFRLPGVVWALLAVWGMGWLARELGQRGHWATVFFVLSPFFLVPSRLGRYYGASLCGSVFVMAAYLAMRREGRGWAAGLWLVFLFHHNMMHAAALSAGLLFHWLCTGRPNLGGALRSVGVTAALLLPWVWWLELGGGGEGFSLSTLMHQAPKTLWLILAGFWSLPLIVWVFWKRRDLGSLPGLALAVALPLCALMAASRHVAPNTRYLLPLLPLGCVALGFAFEAPWRKGLVKMACFILLVGSNLAHLVPLALVHLAPQEKMTSNNRSAGDARRFFAATASPRFLLLSHMGELTMGCQDPSVALREALVGAGYKAGETVSLVTPASRQEALERTSRDSPEGKTLATSPSGGSSDTRYFLTQAMFYIYGGQPGEMISQDFGYHPEAPWQVVAPGAEPEPGGEWVATTDVPPGFWIDGPDPFNRRYTTVRGEGFRIYKTKELKK